MTDREAMEINDVHGWIVMSGIKMDSIRLVDLPHDYQVVCLYPTGRSTIEQLRVKFKRRADRNAWYAKLQRAIGNR